MYNFVTWTTCQDRTRWDFLGQEAVKSYRAKEVSPDLTAGESPCPQELFSGSCQWKFSQLCNVYCNINSLELCGSLKAAFSCKTFPFHLLQLQKLRTSVNAIFKAVIWIQVNFVILRKHHFFSSFLLYMAHFSYLTYVDFMHIRCHSNQPHSLHKNTSPT